MPKIVAMISKEVRLRFASWTELLFFLILPLVFSFILGGMNFGGNGDDNRLRLMVVNEDSSPLASELLAALEQSPSVRTELVTQAAAAVALTEQEVVAWLLLPTGLGEQVLAGQTAVLPLQKAPNTTDALIAEQAIQATLGTLTRAVTVASRSVAAAEQQRPFANAAERQAYFATSLELAQQLVSKAPPRVEIAQPVASSTVGQFDAAAHQSAGQLLTWVLIPLLGTSAYLTFERTRGTLRRLLATPTRRSTYLLGTVLAHLLMGLVQMALLVLFGIYVLGVNWGHSLAGLGVMLFAFGLASVALGVTLGALVKTESQASSLSIMLGMSLALLGGAWVPLEVFPAGVQTAVHLLPSTWAMRGLSDIVLRGQGLADVALEGAVLLGFALLFFAIGVWRFRVE